MYDEFGGLETCRAISTQFYARVAKDPVLRPLFSKSFTCAIEEFAAFLAQFLGGPCEDSQRRWWLSLHESHRRFKIGPKERDAWLKLMVETLDQSAIPEAHKVAFKALFDRSSAYIINQTSTTAIPLLANHWELQLQLDQAVAAIRQRNPDAPTLVTALRQNPVIFAGLLTLLIHSGQALEYVTGSIDATLANIPHRFHRTLLHEAAGAGQVEVVRHLLELGANPNAGRQTPLYAVSNECRKPQEGAAIVRALAGAGATVNFQDNHQRTTPLHMAARQGFLEIAKALLDSGALVNLRDRNGDTPLRRALNCKRPLVAQLLRQHQATL